MVLNDIYGEANDLEQFLINYNKYTDVMKSIITDVDEKMKKCLFNLKPGQTTDYVFRVVFDNFSLQIHGFAEYGVEIGLDNANIKNRESDYFNVLSLKKYYEYFFKNITKWMIKKLVPGHIDDNELIYEVFSLFKDIVNETEKLNAQIEQTKKIKDFTNSTYVFEDEENITTLKLKFETIYLDINYVAQSTVAVAGIVNFVNNVFYEDNDKLNLIKLESGSNFIEIIGPIVSIGGVAGIIKGCVWAYKEWQEAIKRGFENKKAKAEYENELINNTIYKIKLLDEFKDKDISVEHTSKLENSIKHQINVLCTTKDVKLDEEIIDLSEKLLIEEKTEFLGIEERE